MEIQLLPVQSGTIKAVGYDHATQTLAIQFASGTTYHYDDVPQSVYDKLMADDSKGVYFAKFIRGKFDSRLAPAKKEEDQQEAQASA